MRSFWPCLASSLALLATRAHAAPMTYAAALDLAERSAPSLQASRLQIDAARAAGRAAGHLPDPKLSLGVQDYPVGGPNAGSFTRDDFTMAKVGVVQDVPNGARRQAERDAAAADVGVAEAETARVRREVRVATALAWIDLAYAERRLAALDQLVAGLRDLWAGQPAAIASGAARPAAGMEPMRLRAEFDDRRSELVAAVAKARADLTRWTGDPSPSTAGEAPDEDVDSAKLRANLDRHPDLVLAEATEHRAGVAVAAARAAERPDLGFEVSYGHRDPKFGDMLSAGVTVSLPLFRGTRQEPIVAARIAEQNRASIERVDRRRALVAALDADLADHVMHHEQWHRALEELVPAAEQRAHLEVASYGAGRASFDDVRAALTDLANSKLEALAREAMVARDGARITLIYGSDAP